MSGPRNCTSVLYVFFQDHLLGGSPGYCLSNQYRQQNQQRLIGRLTAWCAAFSGPAGGRWSGLSGFSAVRFCTTSHEVSPLLITVRWLREKPNPFWEFELTTCIESIVLCVRPSPSGFVSYSTECAKLYAASKRSSGDIEQGGWGVQLTQ